MFIIYTVELIEIIISFEAPQLEIDCQVTTEIKTQERTSGLCTKTDSIL
jgi:hypothetical protein